MSKRFVLLTGLLAGLAAMAACGGGSSSTTSTGSGISSLSDVPEVDSIVKGGSTSLNISGGIDKAVSGANDAPLLKSITSTSAKTYFWSDGAGGSVIDNIIGGAVTEANRVAFWRGEGSCRMAQMVGYSMQNLKQAGTSICYLKQMPAAIGPSGIVPQGSATPITVAADTFKKQASDAIFQVNTTNDPEGNQAIYIKVLGSDNAELTAANDYGVDIWFCPVGATSPNGYERVRYNSSASTITQAHVSTGWGNFQSTFSSKVALNATTGLPEFDTTAERVATATFNTSAGGSPFTEKMQVSVSGGYITAKNFHNDANFQFKNYAIAQFNASDDTINTLKFLQAGYKNTNLSSTNPGVTYDFNGGTEFQTNRYVGLDNVLLLSDATLGSAVNGYSMADDSFFSTAPTVADIDTASIASYSCSPTVNYVISMDFSAPAVAAADTVCGSQFSSMQFCDGASVQQARQALWTAFVQ